MTEKLSVTQSFALFALAGKPSARAFHRDETGVGLSVGGIMELLAAGAAHLDEKGRLVLDGPLPADLAYLAPLHETVEELRPKKPSTVAKKYVMAFLNRRMNELAEAVAASLVMAGRAVQEDGAGLFGSATRYVVPPASLNAAVEDLRRAVLSDAPLDDDTIVLSSLLKHAKLLNRYFSKYEANHLKARLKQIKNSDSNKLARQIQRQIDALYAATAAVAVSATS